MMQVTEYRPGMEKPDYLVAQGDDTAYPVVFVAGATVIDVVITAHHSFRHSDIGGVEVFANGTGRVTLCDDDGFCLYRLVVRRNTNEAHKALSFLTADEAAERAEMMAADEHLLACAR